MGVDNVKELATKYVNQIMGGNCYLVIIYFISLIFIVIFTYSIYLRKELTKEVASLDRMRKLNREEIDDLSALTDVEYDKEQPLVNYLVYGSFNSCCTGDIINGHVSTQALTEVINLGVRLLDFEIYFKNGKVVVAAGRNNIYMKDTYNEIDIGTVLSTVEKKAFSARNASDPLILNFRIISKNPNVFDSLEKSIKEHFSDKLVPIHTSYRNGNNNILFENIKELKGKVIIFVDDKYKNFTENEGFVELVNGHGGGKIRYLTNYSVLNESSPAKYERSNHDNFSITLPDTESQKNPAWEIHFKNGMQGVLMNFGYNDDKLKSYRKFFQHDKGKAFVLKPSPILNK